MVTSVTPCATDTIDDVLCKIFCQTRREGHAFKADPANAGKRFDYSRRAKELAETSYAASLERLGDFVPERSFLVSVAKGSLGTAARKVYTEAALKARVLKEAAEKVVESAGKKAAGKVATKVALKFIPIVNVLSLAWDVYDVASTGYEIYESVSEFMKKYDTFRIRPDVAQMGPDGEVKKIFDYKFDYPGGGADSMSAEQRRLYFEKAGQRPVEINQAKCGCR